MPKRYYTIRDWSGGMNNRRDPRDLAENEYSHIQNMSIDSLGKIMMIKNELDKRGLKVKDLTEYKGADKQTLDDAALNAEKWLFDYSNVKQSVRYLRNAPFGAPFMSFTSLVAPLMVETVITKPW